MCPRGIPAQSSFLSQGRGWEIRQSCRHNMEIKNGNAWWHSEPRTAKAEGQCGSHPEGRGWEKPPESCIGQCFSTLATHWKTQELFSNTLVCIPPCQLTQRHWGFTPEHWYTLKVPHWFQPQRGLRTPGLIHLPHMAKEVQSGLLAQGQRAVICWNINLNLPSSSCLLCSEGLPCDRIPSPAFS